MSPWEKGTNWCFKERARKKKWSQSNWLWTQYWHLFWIFMQKWCYVCCSATMFLTSGTDTPDGLGWGRRQKKIGTNTEHKQGEEADIHHPEISVLAASGSIWCLTMPLFLRLPLKAGQQDLGKKSHHLAPTMTTARRRSWKLHTSRSAFTRTCFWQYSAALFCSPPAGFLLRSANGQLPSLCPHPTAH